MNVCGRILVIRKKLIFVDYIPGISPNMNLQQIARPGKTFNSKRIFHRKSKLQMFFKTSIQLQDGLNNEHTEVFIDVLFVKNLEAVQMKSPSSASRNRDGLYSRS